MKKHIIFNLNTFFIFSLLSMFVFSGCIKTQTKTHWDLLSRKDGVWNVDKFTVNWFTPNGVHATKTEVFENAGEFTFVRTGEDGHMSFSGSIPLDGNNSYGPFYENEADVITSSIDANTQYEIVFIDKKHLRMYVPRLSNAFFTQFFDYSFYIECSKK